MKRRSILMSVLALALCLSLVAAGTYALFSDKVTIKNHLQAGTLDITLIRTNLKTRSLDSTTGLLALTENSEDVDFSNPNDKSIFDITDKTLLVPACWYEAEMQISNNSDVAFGYWIEIDFGGSVDQAFASQLEITVTSQKGTYSKTVNQSDGLIGAENDPIGIVAKTGSQLFTVRVEFRDLDDTVNNNAKKQNTEFDIIVHAIQVVELPK